MKHLKNSHIDDDTVASGCAPDGGGQLAGPSSGVQPLPRVVTTGGNKHQHRPDFSGVDQNTGEPVELLSNGRRTMMIRHMRTDEVVNSSVALIDALAFSVTPPVKHSYVWLLREMSAFLDLGPIELKGGLFGFRYSARFGDGAGVVAWGGESQNGRVYFSLMGQGCSRIRDWPALAAWLEQHKAVIKRVDCAYDDLEGHRVNIAWAVQQYHGGGFSGAIGRKPAHSTSGDWLDGEASTKGRTLYIGNRANGKVCRVYEKGKQLGDPVSAWTRVEVEWHDQDRYIPYDVLTRPGCYLAGAYPCLAFLDQQQDVIKTVAKAATVAFDSAMEVAKRHMGKLVNLALHVFGGDYFEVVDRLKRPGIPARIAPYSYHVERNPAMLDPAMREAFA